MFSTPRVWLVTGCSSGFGKLFVSAILARGERVIATARNLHALQDLPAHDNLRMLALDVSSSQETLNQIMTTAIDLFGRIDVLVNNAGYVLSGVWEEVSHTQVMDQFTTNFFGPLNVTRALLPHLRERQTGTILFMSSIAGWLGVAAGGPYSASKFALEGAVESLQKEVSSFGVEVHLAVLGQFRTEILSSDRRRIVRPEKPITEYDTVVRRLQKRQGETNGKQPGDPVLAVNRLLDVVRREGCMARKDSVPLRLVLGSDAMAIVRSQCQEVLRDLEHQTDIGQSTDFPGAEVVREYK